MAAWDAPPGGVATRLGSADQRDPFRLRPDPALLTEHPEQAWATASHALGRGRMRADQVFVKGGGFTLGLTTVAATVPSCGRATGSGSASTWRA